MFKKNPKHRFIFLVLTLVIFLAVAISFFYEYDANKVSMKLNGGILFLLMAVFQVKELYVLNKIEK